MEPRSAAVKRALILSGGGGRGPFQTGVWRYLRTVGWRPDLVCGASVGAINAVAIGCGLSPEAQVRLWRAYTRRRLFRFRPIRFAAGLRARRRFVPLADTRPLEEMLRTHIDFGRLRGSEIRIIVPAVNLRTARLRYFDEGEITVDHLMAASAIPLFFPWRTIDGDRYWDGGIMATTPILPALEAGAESIVVVMLSPVGTFAQPEPRSLKEVVEMVYEHFLLGSYQGSCAGLLTDRVKVAMVAPVRPLGLRSIFTFDPRQADRLVEEGYRCAESQLNGRFSATSASGGT